MASEKIRLGVIGANISVGWAHRSHLPALLASFFLSSSRMSRELLGQYVHALYPYLQAELFLRWTPEQLDEVIDQWLKNA